MAEPALLYEEMESLAVLTLNRPDRLNALTPALVEELRGRLETIQARGRVRAVVLTGAGRGFCAGQDVAALGGWDAGQLLRERYHPLLLTLRDLEIPVVAAVNGVAAGVGLSLALACDVRIACASARFVTAFERIGLVPDGGLTYTLSAMVGLGRAMEWLLLGRTLSAEEALQAGLVSRVVDDDRFASAWQELARQLAAGPRSVGYTRRLMWGLAWRSFAEHLQEEARLQSLAGATGDAREGIQAFLEKRTPVFRGR